MSRTLTLKEDGEEEVDGEGPGAHAGAAAAACISGDGGEACPVARVSWLDVEGQESESLLCFSLWLGGSCCSAHPLPSVALLFCITVLFF
jgi:hypothetical protein